MGADKEVSTSWRGVACAPADREESPTAAAGHHRSSTAAATAERPSFKTTTSPSASQTCRRSRSPGTTRHPHAMLIVSPSTPMAATADNGEAMNPWLDLAFEAGFVPVASAVFHAAPEVIEGTCSALDVARHSTSSPGR